MPLFSFRPIMVFFYKRNTTIGGNKSKRNIVFVFMFFISQTFKKMIHVNLIEYLIWHINKTLII